MPTEGDISLKLVFVLISMFVSSSLVAETRSIAFVHTHTGESISIAFKKDGAFIPENVAALNRFLRDFRNGKATDMDPQLFDILYEIRERVGSTEAFQLISAYRSPETNEMLRRTTSGVAKNSMHSHGRAIDVRLPDVETRRLREVALGLKQGGVGYYERSNFIHVDTGRVRFW